MTCRARRPHRAEGARGAFPSGCHCRIQRRARARLLRAAAARARANPTRIADPRHGDRSRRSIRASYVQYRPPPQSMRLLCLRGAALFVFLAVAHAATADAQSRPELRWGGDAEGGAPFVEADPNDPSRVVGFEVEVATLLAEGLGRVPRFVQVGFTSLDALAARGDFDIGLSGIEDSPARRARLAVTIPYYEFREILTVRAADRERFRSLADLRGRRVATLGATLAYDLLVEAQSRDG